MKSTKATFTKATTTPASEEATTQQQKLTPMELSCICFLTAKSYDKASKDDLATEATFPEAILTKLEGFKNTKNEPSPLVTITRDAEGNITDVQPTEFAKKWALKSTTFGINFNKLCAEVETGTLHSLLFSAIKELAEVRHKDRKIFYFKRDSNEVSPFWDNFNNGINDLDSCLEPSPENA